MIVTYLYLGFIFVNNSGLEGDAYRYKLSFINGSYGEQDFEKGYLMLRNVIKLFGVVDFNVYLLILFIILSILTIKGIGYFTDNFHPYLAMIMGYTFLGLTQGLRFALAMAIVIYGIHFCYEGNIIKYFFCIAFAFLIHRSTAFFIINILATPNNNIVQGFINRSKGKKRVWVLCIAIIIVLLTYWSGSLPGVNLIFSFIDWLFGSDAVEIKLEVYGRTLTRLGGVLYIFIYASMLIFAFFASKLSSSNAFDDKEDNSHKRITFLLNIMLCIAMALPLIVLNVEFRRYLMVCQVVVSIMMSIIMDQSIDKRGKILINTKQFCLSLLFNLSIFAWYVPTLLGIINHRITVEGVFENLLMFK